MSVVITNLTKKYSSKESSTTILHIPSFEIESGNRIALIGRSGSGKSTFLNIIAGIVSPTSGCINIDGTELTSLSESERDVFRAKHIGYVFQTFNLIQGLTALENILLAMSFNPKTKVSEPKARELLSRVGLQKKMNNKPSELSVGEQQRVAVARAVSNDASLILADEPTANLDEQSSDDVLNLLDEICTEKNRSLILVTHERDVAARLPKILELKSLNKV